MIPNPMAPSQRAMKTGCGPWMAGRRIATAPTSATIAAPPPILPPGPPITSEPANLCGAWEYDVLTCANAMRPNPSPSPPLKPAAPPQGDVELLERLAAARADLLAQVGRRIIGQHAVLDGILTAIFSGGHALLLGVPGL